MYDAFYYTAFINAHTDAQFLSLSIHMATFSQIWNILLLSPASWALKLCIKVQILPHIPLRGCDFNHVVMILTAQLNKIHLRDHDFNRVVIILTAQLNKIPACV